MGNGDTDTALRVHEVSPDSEVLDEIGVLRVRVWEQAAGIRCGKRSWLDDNELTSRHFIARNDKGELVAAGRVTVRPALADFSDFVILGAVQDRLREFQDGPVAYFGRLVVCPTVRRQGLATQILELREQAAIEDGARWGVQLASPDIVRIIEKCNWQLRGPADFELGHVSFTLATKSFPAQC